MEKALLKNIGNGIQEIREDFHELKRDVGSLKMEHIRQRVLLEQLTSEKGLPRCAEREIRLDKLEKRNIWIDRIVAGLTLGMAGLFIEWITGR